MVRAKWGESFLKSGLPLEHLTQVTFRSMQWPCSPRFEYVRRNREKEETWFEVDLVATCTQMNKDTDLEMLVECKYHDLSRYWFFLPHDSGGRWCFDDRVLNCGPYQSLRSPRSNTFLQLAPQSSGGIVVSKDGTKQDNAVATAVEQVVNGFVPRCLESMFSYNIDFHNVMTPQDELTFVPNVTALVPVIVTNAALFRLKSDVTDLDLIRNAAAPNDIAEEVEWTWYYHDVPTPLSHQNHEAIERHLRDEAELVYRFPHIEEEMYRFIDRPNWIAVVNIKALAKAADAIAGHFLTLKTFPVKSLICPRPIRKRKRK